MEKTKKSDDGINNSSAYGKCAAKCQFMCCLINNRSAHRNGKLPFQVGRLRYAKAVSSILTKDIGFFSFL
jgi:hypothetical protein